MPKTRARFASIPEAIFARAAKDGLTAGEFQVLAAILLCVNWRSGEAWPSVARLQEITGRGEETVTKAKARLAQAGYIACGWRSKKGGGHTMKVLFDLDGNPREIQGQSGGDFRGNLAGFSGSKWREKPTRLPSSHPENSIAEQSHEHRHEQSQGTADPFAVIECKHLGNGKQRTALGEAFQRFLADGRSVPLLIGTTPSDLWGQVMRSVVRYHELRLHRMLPCDYEGCVQAPAEKIAKLAGCKKSPASYLDACLGDLLPKEADRAQENRESAARSRTGGGLARAGEFLTALPIGTA